MSNRFQTPLEQFEDATGAPYAGAKLYFYSSGTSSKLSTYSDSGLTIANTNPVVLDSAGRLPNAVFLQVLQYKVVLAPSTDTDPPTAPIWTQDPVYTSDYSAQAKFKSGSGSPNGVVAGTAGSATISADAYWDYTNNILYICTTTGNAATAVWTAVNATTAAAVIPPPQGYLTLTSGTPVITGDVTAATSVYYTPYSGLLVPIYNGASFVPTSIVSELQLTLVSAHAASQIYDVFIFNNNGVATVVTGPTWAAGTSGSVTAGSCARGTGTGGAALARVQGIYTNAVQITARNGSTTYTINANLATYVGSIFMDGTNGQVSCYRSYGQSRKWGVWNLYNQQTISFKAGDGTGSWIPSGTLGPANAATANSLTTFCGLAQSSYELVYRQGVSVTGAASPSTILAGLGVNSTTVASGHTSSFSAARSDAGTIVNVGELTAEYLAAPSLGINTITALLQLTNSGSALGTESRMVLQSTYSG